jgi:hypothetical protein
VFDYIMDELYSLDDGESTLDNISVMEILFIELLNVIQDGNSDSREMR